MRRASDRAARVARVAPTRRVVFRTRRGGDIRRATIQTGGVVARRFGLRKVTSGARGGILRASRDASRWVRRANRARARGTRARTMPVSSNDASSALSLARTPGSTTDGPALKLCFHLVGFCIAKVVGAFGRGMSGRRSGGFGAGDGERARRVACEAGRRTRGPGATGVESAVRAGVSDERARRLTNWFDDDFFWRQRNVPATEMPHEWL